MKLIRFNNQPNYFNLFDNFFEREFGELEKNCGHMPATNIIDKKESFELELAVPGLQKEDFKISLENNLLTISSEKECKKTDEDSTYSRKEFSYCSFSRSFTLPKTVNTDDINAQYENGLLKIVLPKKEELISKVSKEIQVM
ncbi:MAG: Hsp20/alpha crystallin family protein [Bacteroidetes bacterium]|nr:Hsp20/alpha crystallin family protein [Bacteroidota bacterium]